MKGIRPRCPRCGGNIVAEPNPPWGYQLQCLLCSRPYLADPYVPAPLQLVRETERI